MRDTEVITDLVNRMTATNYDFIAGRAVWAPSLLEQLGAAVGASTGGSGSNGSSSIASERSAFNASAFALYEDITGRIATLYHQATERTPTPDPQKNLIDWLREFHNADTRGEITDKQRRTARTRLAHFVERVTDFFDPPTVKEIIGKCPECGERYWPIDREGTRIATLYIAVTPGRELRAICHWCAESWTGSDELEDLYVEIAGELWEKEIRRKLARWRRLCASFSLTA